MVNILVADDSKLSRIAVRSELKKYKKEDIDFVIIEVSDGNQALDIVNTKSIDLIFLDCNMPNCDGIQFVTKLRNNKKTSGINVVMVTALSGDDDRSIAYSAGVNDFVNKPLSNIANSERFKEALVNVGFIEEDI